MAVVGIDRSYFEKTFKKYGLGIEEVIETLNKMGFPSEIEEETVYVEVTPNRPDMLGWKGIIRAVLNYLELEKPTEYKMKGKRGEVFVEKVESREYINLAVVEGVREKEFLYESLIDLQEKLHSTIGRNRKKVAIGIHNLNVIEFPLFYREVEDERFVPLDMKEEMSVKEILEKHEKGIKYKHLVKDRFPIIYDKKGVISFPPIINSERTKIDENTENFLVDVTGTHKESVEKVLNIIVSELIDRGGQAYWLEVINKGEKSCNFEYEWMVFEKERIERLLGFSFKNENRLLMRMGLKKRGEEVLIPPYRVDFMDFSDLAEEIAIAYGYENILPKEFQFYQEGNVDKELENIKDIFTNMGFLEVVNFYLTSRKDVENFGFKEYKEVLNPTSIEYAVLRPSLVIGLVNNIKENKREQLPLMFFEIGRVYDEREELRLGFVIADKEIDINYGLEVLKRFEMEIEEKFEFKRVEKEFLIKGRSFEFRGKELKGIIGEVHPKINEIYNIDLPMVVGELSLPL